jgi:hypothetical protein
MEHERHAVLKIWPEHEIFRVIYIRKDTTWETSPDLEEPQLRAELTKLGHTKPEIESLIQKARKNPV